MRGRREAWIGIAAFIVVGILASQAFAGCESDVPPSCPPRPQCPPICESANVGVGAVGAQKVPGRLARGARTKSSVWMLITLRALAAAMNAR